MKIEFYYDNKLFVVDPGQHMITIDGEEAAGGYAPVGGVVVDVNEEELNICKVITDIDELPLEKIIIYGAPLKINDKVIILKNYVIPADLLVRNDLEGDYGYWSDQLKQKAEAYIETCKHYADKMSGYFGGELEALTHKLVGDASGEIDSLIDDWGGNQ